MNFKEYVAHVKAIPHIERGAAINGFKDHFNLMESEADVMTMAELIVLVCGQTGEWEKGSELLKKLKNNAKISDKNAMNRNVAILELGNNPNISLEKFSSSDQVMIAASVAVALVGLGGFKNAQKLFNKAIELAVNLPKEDPAIKTLVSLAGHMAKTIESMPEKTGIMSELGSSAQEVIKKYK